MESYYTEHRITRKQRQDAVKKLKEQIKLRPWKIDWDYVLREYGKR